MFFYQKRYLVFLFQRIQRQRKEVGHSQSHIGGNPSIRQKQLHLEIKRHAKSKQYVSNSSNFLIVQALLHHQDSTSKVELGNKDSSSVSKPLAQAL